MRDEDRATRQRENLLHRATESQGRPPSFAVAPKRTEICAELSCKIDEALGGPPLLESCVHRTPQGLRDSYSKFLEIFLGLLPRDLPAEGIVCLQPGVLVWGFHDVHEGDGAPKRLRHRHRMGYACFGIFRTVQADEDSVSVNGGFVTMWILDCRAPRFPVSGR